MSNRTNPELARARKLAAALRASMRDRLERGTFGALEWTEQQRGLLSNICTELGVDAPEHLETLKAGEELARSYGKR